MTPESLKPEGRYNRPRIGEPPPAGDKQGRYEWMKRAQDIKRQRRQKLKPLDRQSIADDWGIRYRKP